MIIIKRSYEVARPEGGGYKTVVSRKSFNDDDTTGVDAFINERGTIPGYPWYNVKFEYTKL
jgi:hypothetical protein